MKFDYDRLVEAPASTVWDALTDTAAIEPHLQGSAKVVSTGSNSFRISMKISLGFLRPTVNANVQLSNISIRRFTIELSGKSMGAEVLGKAEVILKVAGRESESTVVQLIGSVETSGMIKKVADSKIKAAAIGFLESYFASVERACSRV